MNKKYAAPDMEITVLNLQDVITSDYNWEEGEGEGDWNENWNSRLGAQ